MFELNFNFILIFDEIELNVLYLFSFNNLAKLLQKVHLGCLALDLSHQTTYLRDFFL